MPRAYVLPIPLDCRSRTDDHAFEAIRRRHGGECRKNSVVVRGNNDLPSKKRNAADLRISIDVDVERSACADGTIAGDQPCEKNVVVRCVREKSECRALVPAYQTLDSGLL
jgi:hypothetical protein